MGTKYHGIWTIPSKNKVDRTFICTHLKHIIESVVIKNINYITFFIALTISIHSKGSIFAPSIQCTVIKVHSTSNILGQKAFPKLYQNISYNPIRGIFILGSNKFKNLIPKTILKTNNLERILIKYKQGQLELQIHGKPISRNGILKQGQNTLADITCH